MVSIRIATVTVVTLGLTACAAGSDAGARKAGAAPAVLHLAMADSQPADAPTGVAMLAFAGRVAALSKGAMVVETVSAGPYAGDGHGDEKVVEALISGRVQVATVPARGWSDAGIRSTDVLLTPFEVMTNDHMVAVARDTVVQAKAFAGLRPKGVRGLALFPEALRYLVGFRREIRTPADLANARMRTISPRAGALLQLLGAKTSSPSDDEYARMRSDGELDGTETDLARASSLASSPATLTADLVLYAKLDTIAVNAAWWDRLTDDQRGVLEAAAAAARETAISALRPTASQAEAFCSAGGSIVFTGPDGLRAFRTAVSSWAAEVDQSALAAVRGDRPATVEAPPATCAPSQDGLDPKNVVASAGALPDGVYRIQYTRAQAEAWNAAAGPQTITFSGQDAPETFRTFTFTWTLTAGHYVFELSRDGRAPFRRTGVYQVVGDQMLLALDPEIGDVVNRLRWRTASDGSLEMTQVDGLKRDMFYGQPWTRIGPA